MPVDGGRRTLAHAAGQLRARWRDASERAGWAFPQDWWVPAVDAVAEAVCEGRSLTGPCAELGRARADCAVGLDETLADLAALHSAAAGIGGLGWSGALGVAEVPGSVVRATAVGWAETACDPALVGGCEDPLTGLMTTSYLRGRLGEVYRDGECTGQSPASTHAFVVVAVGSSAGAGLLSLGRAVLVGSCLRTAFSAGETLCGGTPGRALALVRRDSRLAERVAALQRLLAGELDRPAARSCRVWVEGLPGTLAAALRLVDELSR